MKKFTFLFSLIALLAWQGNAQPVNDDISGAIELTLGNGSCSAPVSGTNTGATDSGIPHSCASYSGGDVWFYVIVPAGGTFSVEGTITTGFTDGGMQAYTGPSTGPLVSINCDDDDSPSGNMPGIYPADGLQALTPGDTIWLAFWEYGNNSFGAFDICAWLPPPPPANDDISGAVQLTLGVGACATPVSGYNDGATDSGVPHSCASYAGGDVWYYVIVPAGGTFSVEGTITTGFTDGGMQAYTGPSTGPLVSINCDDDDSPSGNMPGIYPADGLQALTPGDTIWFAFWEYGNNSFGPFDICAWGPPTCPAPTALNTSNITATSADLGWTTGGANNWVIEWGPTGFTQGTGTIVNTNTNPHNLGGLTAATTYDWYVRDFCGAGDSSLWVGPNTFTTLCLNYTPNYLENFDTFLPNCWDEADAGDPFTGPSTLGSGPWQASTALGTSARINLYTTSRSDWLLSPMFDLSSGGYELSIDVAVTDWNSAAVDSMGSDDTVRVMYTENGTTWNNLLTWTAANALPNSLTNFTVMIPSTGNNVQFGILATDGPINDAEDYDFHVDSFIVRTPVITEVNENINMTALNLYPNPNSGVFTLNMNTDGIDDIEIRVINMHGQVVYSKNKFNNASHVIEQIDLSNNAKGIYFVHVTSNKGTLSKKVVVQ